jgi:hypothetical protein
MSEASPLDPCASLGGPPDREEYRQDLEERELALIKKRRELVRAEPKSGPLPDGTEPEGGSLPDGTVGLALSGGGIRSATFNLGVLQALARARVLRQVDYLSTVSGGGYIGGFLGRLYTRFLNRPAGVATLVESKLANPNAAEIEWLRQNGNYLAPTGKGDNLVNAAVVLRNFLTLHTVLALLLFGIFGVANLLRFGAFPWLDDALHAWLPASIRLPGVNDLPLSHMLREGWGFFWSPWMTLVELLIFLGLIPLGLAFWLASVEKPEAYQPSALKAVFLVASALLVAALFVADAPSPHVLLLALSLIASCFYVELAWQHVRRRLPGGLRHPSTRPMVRNSLTHWLGHVLGLTLLAVAFVLVDTAGFAVYGWAASRPDFAEAFGQLGAGLAALYVPLRWIAGKLGGRIKPTGEGGRKSTLLSVVTHPMILPVIFGLPPLVFCSAVAHALFARGEHLLAGLLATALALLISAILGRKDALPFINRSSLQALYAARIARAFLGASNFFRHVSEEGHDVTTTQAEDDTSFHAYHPEASGGPLHLVNVCVNETLDHFSQRRFRERQGENMSVGPCGVSIGWGWHGLWIEPERWGGEHGRLRAIQNHQPPHPLIGEDGAGLDPAKPITTESLSLSTWLSISGAAISPGRGRDSKLGTSLFFGLANLRAGYWWDTNLEDYARPGVRRPTLLQALFFLPVRLFRMQWLLLAELTADFSGPWRRFWYLSDAGFFEGTGVYELVRRRVKYILCGDALHDDQGTLDSLANLMRKVRIDFGAEIRFLDEAEIQGLPRADPATGTPGIPAAVLAALGSIDEVRGTTKAFAKKHAALARIYYPDKPAHQGVLLYLKAGVTGDEAPDILSYHADHPHFPHEPTSDQFFHEAQWESYRSLGDHSMSLFFAEPSASLWLTHV